MSQLKEVFKVKESHGAFYTGGDVEWTKDGDTLLFQCGSKVQVLDVDQGQVVSSISEEVPSTGLDDDIEEDIIITFILSDDSEILICYHRSRLFKMWNWKENKLLKVWQSMHKVPVSRLAISSDHAILATGATDASIRLWNLEHHACTHNLPVVNMYGVISVLVFHELENETLLFGSADDAVIKAWNVKSGLLEKEFKGHFSKVTGLCVYKSTNHLISCSRDKALIIWDIITCKAVHVIPAYESLEALTIISDPVKVSGNELHSNEGALVAIAGEKGLLRIWDTGKAEELYVDQESLVPVPKQEYGFISRLVYNNVRKKLAMVNTDHIVLIRDIENDFAVDKQLVGFSDEILDVVFIGENHSHMALATNSSNIQLYTRSSFSCQLLKGHTDLVISLAVTEANRSLLVSGAKDNSIRVWLLSKSGIMNCVATGCRHTASVSSVALGNLNSNLVVSGSIDTTIKLWILPKKFKSDEIEFLNIKYTELAHDKDINSVCISPNDKIVATGSLDKTAKLWDANDLSLIGVLKGHRRGIWCVRFSPVDRVVLTSSADAMIKLWSLTDFSCLKTFEGHESSVLCAEFITKGLQIISGGGDGLLKLWCIKTSECVATFDEHEGKIWALTVSDNEDELVTGGDDSKLLIWKDVTEETRAEAINKRQEYILQEQELSNLIHNEKLLPALKLALSLDRPATVLKIINSVQQEKQGLAESISSLDIVHKEALLKCASIWNSNTKSMNAAQIVISLLLSDITNRTINVDKSIMESILVYTERHFKRMTQMQQDLKVLLYTADIMQPRAEA